MACSPDLGSDLDIPDFAPEAMSDGARAALKYLNPDGEVSDGHWVPGEQTRERWRVLTEGMWNSRGLEELTAAMAAVSTLCDGDDQDASVAATWTTARSIEFAVDRLSFEDYTETVKENLAMVVANTADQGVRVAKGGSAKGLGLYSDDAAKDLDDGNSLYATLIYRIIDNEDAAAVVASAFMDAALQHDPGVTGVMALEAKYQGVASVYGFLCAIESERMTGALGADADYDSPITINSSTLESLAYADAVNQGMFTDPEAFNPEYLQGEYGEPYSWYATDDDGTVRFNLDDPPTSEQSGETHDWASKVRFEHDPEDAVSRVDSGINVGIQDGLSLIYGGDGVGGEPGAIKLKKD